MDFLVGLRYTRLDESLMVFEDLYVFNQQDPDFDTAVQVTDRFTTSNDFFGGDIGFDWQWERNRWSLGLLSKLAIGNNRQVVSISGLTEVLPNATDPATNPATDTQSEEEGLLALSTNSGRYERDEFSVIPEIGVTVGYQLTHRLRLTAGYTLLYWANVVRPGDQIDREINTTLLPGVDPADVEPIPQRPQFDFMTTNLWAHGLNLGGEYRW